jgi:hypothetical protein
MGREVEIGFKCRLVNRLAVTSYELLCEAW